MNDWRHENRQSYPKSYRKTFAENFKRLLKEKHITQKSIAEFFGVSKITVGGWVKGSYLPAGNRLLKLAELLETTPEELIGYANPNKECDEFWWSLIGNWKKNDTAEDMV